MQGNKLDDAVQFMRKMKIGIMAIQETTIAINHTFNIEEYTVITSTSNTQVAEPMVIEKVNWKSRNRNKQEGPREYAGVGIIYHKDYQPSILYFRQFRGRNMEVGLRTNAQPLIINTI